VVIGRIEQGEEQRRPNTGQDVGITQLGQPQYTLVELVVRNDGNGGVCCFHFVIAKLQAPVFMRSTWVTRCVSHAPASLAR
jgi:hypothetical protein